MEISSLSFDEVKLVFIKKNVDNRGLFCEIFNEKLKQLLNLKSNPLQVNFSHSHLKDTVRGLHYQLPPFEQGKLIWVIQGEILNVILDVRKDSRTFGQHTKVSIDSDKVEVLYIPPGFANGYCTLKPDTKMCYMLTAPYSPAHERGILWNDSALAIEWPVSEKTAILSDKDKSHHLLKDISKDNLL